jgi:hypothetical protein
MLLSYLFSFSYYETPASAHPHPPRLQMRAGGGFSSPNHPPRLACKHEPGVALLTTTTTSPRRPPRRSPHHHVTHVTTTSPTSPCRPPRHHGSTTPTTATKNDVLSNDPRFKQLEKFLGNNIRIFIPGSNRHLSVAVFLPCCQCRFNSRISSILVLILSLQIITMTCLRLSLTHEPLTLPFKNPTLQRG